MATFFTLLIFAAVFFSASSVPNSRISIGWRLPTTTKPLHYDLHWKIDFETLKFHGTVNIDIVATQCNVSEIVIHAYRKMNLTVDSVLKLGTGVYVETLKRERDFLRIRISDVLQYSIEDPVVYTLTISFDSKLDNDMFGLYRSWFKNNPNDEIHWMIATLFEPTAARLAFPCYDEPSFKATFDITVTRPSSYRSWSNTNLLETRNSSSNGYKEDIYNRTPVMSTYNLALIVAEFNSINISKNGRITYEVIARPGALDSDQGQEAFQLGSQLVATMSAHTGLDFYNIHPNFKLTQAAIPDYRMGAMETWGLITYRESFLMADPNHSDDNDKVYKLYIMSHEIAHSWFGNLVTCEYWDSLWLNEGFATYYQYYLSHWVKGEMGFDSFFINNVVHAALLSDSENNSLPLTNHGLTDQDSITDMFSVITYGKGAAVIRMTEHLLGFEVHRQGLQKYLISRSFDVARPIDLFQALQNASDASGALAQYDSNFSVIEYYKSWTKKGGHPVLNVHVNHTTARITITQSRFNIHSVLSEDNSTWIIPITFATASNPDFNDTKPSHIMKTEVLVLDRCTTGNEWIIFNKQQTGFYRVNYDDYTWKLIVIALSANRTQIHEYNRAQIINDVFQFAEAGIMTYKKAFQIISFLKYESDYLPWVTAITDFESLRKKIVGITNATYTDWKGAVAGEIAITRDFQSAYLSLANAIINTIWATAWVVLHLLWAKDLIIGWATPLMNQLTYYPVANETFRRSYLRQQLASFMCDMNVTACRTAANRQFHALIHNGTEVSPSSRKWVYCNGLRDGSEADFNIIWQRYIQHNVYSEKVRLLDTLGCTPHATSLHSFLIYLTKENYIIRQQDLYRSFSGALNGNEGNTQKIFSFIKNNLELIKTAFGSLVNPLKNIAERLRTVEEIYTFQAWATQNKDLLGYVYTDVLESAKQTRRRLTSGAAVQDDINNYIFGGNDVIIASSTPSTSTFETTVKESTTTINSATTTASTLTAEATVEILPQSRSINVLEKALSPISASDAAAKEATATTESTKTTESVITTDSTITMTLKTTEELTVTTESTTEIQSTSPNVPAKALFSLMDQTQQQLLFFQLLL